MSLTMESVLDRLQTIQGKPAEQSPEVRLPVVAAGRTFRKCAKCERQGWHPEASAEICCGQAMEVIARPAMTVDEYVAFIHCPKHYASGAISKADIHAMMKKDGVHVLPTSEKAVTGDRVAPI